MSYNIWYANPDAGENTWENRRDGVAKAVLDQKADIIGMQEVLLRQLTDLQNFLSNYQWVGVGRDDGMQKGEFAPIFFNSKRFELKLSGNFWLSETPDSTGSMGWDAQCVRIVTWAKLKLKKSDRQIFVFNTHFDHAGDTARIESARLLREKINEIANDDPILLTGDFNCLKDSAPYSQLIQPENGIKLKDCRYSSLKKTEDTDYTFVGSDFNGQPGKIIDHIFVSENIRVISSEIIENRVQGKCPSDHLPVTAVVLIN
jgi:endonuclease/exonuclease/phosphatase family metal-dependent hydrolase